MTLSEHGVWLRLIPMLPEHDVFGTTFARSGQMADSDVCLTVSEVSDNGRYQDDTHTKSYTASNSIS